MRLSEVAHVSTKSPSIVDRFVDIGSRGAVRVRTYGQGSPLLLIDGVGANVSMWTPLATQVEEDSR